MDRYSEYPVRRTVSNVCIRPWTIGGSWLVPVAHARDFGARLREARVTAGLSLRDAAELLGTTTVRLGCVERGVPERPIQGEREDERRCLTCGASLAVIARRARVSLDPAAIYCGPECDPREREERP